MNTEKAQKAINELVAGVKNNRQYPTSKFQDEQLKNLGIYEMMPKTQVKNGQRYIGYTDAAIVITAAQQGEGAVMNAYGEGEETPASALYNALNEKPAPEPTPEPELEPVQILDAVSVYMQTQYDENFNLPQSATVATVAMGQRLFEQGWRVSVTDERHIYGHAVVDNGVPEKAVLFRKVWAGYRAQSPCYRYEYLYKNA